MKKILYVEDNKINYKLVEKVLTRAGYDVIGAEDGLSAIRMAREEKPDLILMDINLPSLSGYEVTTKIKSIEGLEDIPIVAVTARTMKSDREMALATGCIGFITKPINLSTFVFEIDSFLGGREDRLSERQEPIILREYSRQLVSSLEEKVTELQEINRKLLESEERYRALVENVNIGIWFLSSAKETLFLNQRMQDLLDMEEFEPTSPEIFLDSEGRRRFQKYLERCAEGIPQIWESNLRTQKNNICEVVISGVAMFNSTGQNHDYLLSFIDVTEKNKLERQMEHIQKLESLSTLTAGVAHDFNNILTIIKNNIELLVQKQDLKEDDTKKLQNIAGAANRGISLTSQLLDFSRETPPNLERVDPYELVINFCKFFANYKTPAITLSYPTKRDVPEILADPVQIEQILLNLSTNAQDAMPKGGIIEYDVSLKQTIEPERTEMGEQKDYVCILVKDTGTGIDTTVRDRIFEPFFTTKSPGKGTGLGLSAVFGIVKKHGGFLGVESQPGKCAEFQIYLPVAAGETYEVDEMEPRILRQGNYSVLIVDDDELVRDLLGEMLTDLGIKVFFAESLSAAQVVLGSRSSEINFVCLDYQLPDMDMSAILRYLHSATPHIRIVLISGHAFEDILEWEGSLEVDGFLKKPFDLKAITDIFQKLI